MITYVTTPTGIRWARAQAVNEVFAVFFTPVIVRAVLHKEFVGPRSDKLLGGHGFLTPTASMNSPIIGRVFARYWENAALPM